MSLSDPSSSLVVLGPHNVVAEDMDSDDQPTNGLNLNPSPNHTALVEL
jgi:hypothetical protein